MLRSWTIQNSKLDVSYLAWRIKLLNLKIFTCLAMSSGEIQFKIEWRMSAFLLCVPRCPILILTFVSHLTWCILLLSDIFAVKVGVYWSGINAVYRRACQTHIHRTWRPLKCFFDKNSLLEKIANSVGRIKRNLDTESIKYNIRKGGDT